MGFSIINQPLWGTPICVWSSHCQLQWAKAPLALECPGIAGGRPGALWASPVINRHKLFLGYRGTYNYNTTSIVILNYLDEIIHHYSLFIHKFVKEMVLQEMSSLIVRTVSKGNSFSSKKSGPLPSLTTASSVWNLWKWETMKHRGLDDDDGPKPVKSLESPSSHQF